MTAKIIHLPAIPRPPPALAPQPLWLRDLHRAFFAHVSTVAKGKVSLNDRWLAAQALIDEIEPSEADPGNPNRSHVADLRRQASLHRPVRIVGHVAQLPPPQLTTVMEPNGALVDVDATCPHITDLHDDSIRALAVGNGIIDALQEHARHGGPCEFVAIPLALPSRINPKQPTDKASWSPREYVLHLVAVGRPASQLDLTNATDEERMAAERQLDRLRNEGWSPFEYLAQSAVRAVGLVGYGDVEEITRGVDVCVLQSLSYGRLDPATSARIHMMVVGPPGSGKGELGRIARTVQPTFMDVAPGSFSMAGLVGASVRKNGGWSCEPGAIPQASDGVLIAQDAHWWKPSAVQQVASILQEMMQEALVRKTTAGRARFSAATALLIDMNLEHQLETGGRDQKGAGAIARVRPFLSRLDAIIEFPDDPVRARSLAREMFSDSARAACPSVRSLQVLVAALRDRHPSIDLSEVVEHITRRFDEIHEANAEAIRAHPESGFVSTRLVTTLKRLTTAYARGQDRSVAHACDVDAIMPIIEKTLAYLLHQGTKEEAASSGSRAMVSNAWLRTQQGEKSSAEWAAVYCAQTGREIHPRTMQRALLEIGARAGHGRYCLPPPAVHPAESEMDKWTNGHRRSRLLRRRPTGRARLNRSASAHGRRAFGRTARHRLRKIRAQLSH